MFIKTYLNCKFPTLTKKCFCVWLEFRKLLLFYKTLKIFHSGGERNDIGSAMYNKNKSNYKKFNQSK